MQNFGHGAFLLKNLIFLRIFNPFGSFILPDTGENDKGKPSPLSQRGEGFS
jgi:hypothetical protein